jgi:hypothetical protein
MKMATTNQNSAKTDEKLQPEEAAEICIAVEEAPKTAKPARKKPADIRENTRETDDEAVESDDDDGDQGGKTAAQKLAELIEKGKKVGKLTSGELEILDDLNLDADELDKFYDKLASLGIDATGDDALPPLEEDALPSLEEMGEIEEVTDEEIADTDSLVDSFSTDDPVRMYLKEIGAFRS